MLTDSKPVILLPTVKKAEAKEFFQNVLGLDFKYDDGFALVFETGGLMFRLTPVREFTPDPFTVLGWEVDDIESEVSELVARGVTFEKYDFEWMQQDEQGIWTAPEGSKVAWFKDPDGNLLSLSQHAK